MYWSCRNKNKLLTMWWNKNYICCNNLFFLLVCIPSDPTEPSAEQDYRIVVNCLFMSRNKTLVRLSLLLTVKEEWFPLKRQILLKIINCHKIIV